MIYTGMYGPQILSGFTGPQGIIKEESINGKPYELVNKLGEIRDALPVIEGMHNLIAKKLILTIAINSGNRSNILNRHTEDFKEELERYSNYILRLQQELTSLINILAMGEIIK